VVFGYGQDVGGCRGVYGPRCIDIEPSFVRKEMKSDTTTACLCFVRTATVGGSQILSHARLQGICPPSFFPSSVSSLDLSRGSHMQWDAITDCSLHFAPLALPATVFPSPNAGLTFEQPRAHSHSHRPCIRSVYVGKWHVENVGTEPKRG